MHTCSCYVLVRAPHLPKCIRVSATQRWKIDEDNSAFLTIFLIKCQSKSCMNDTNIIWCSIPYQRYHHCSSLPLHPTILPQPPFCSIWGLSSPRIITIIIRTWKERNKCRTAAKEKPWSRSICILHLVPVDVWTSYPGALSLDGTEKQALC